MNLLVLDNYKNSKDSKDYYSGLIKRGKKLVVFNNNGKYFFGPSRFVGYKENNITYHENNDGRDGGLTNNVIIKLLGKPVESEKLEKEYIKLCDLLGIDIHNNNRMSGTKRLNRLIA